MAAVVSSHNVTAKAERDKKTHFSLAYFLYKLYKISHIFIALWRYFSTFDTSLQMSLLSKTHSGLLK